MKITAEKGPCQSKCSQRAVLRTSGKIRVEKADCGKKIKLKKRYNQSIASDFKNVC